MVSFDTNILVYATSAAPHAKMNRARDLVARGMQAGGSILLLQTLAEFSNVAIRKAGLPAGDVLAIIDSWRTLLPVQAADVGDITAALQVVKTHRLAFWDAFAVGFGAACWCALFDNRGHAGWICFARRDVRQPV